MTLRAGKSQWLLGSLAIALAVSAFFAGWCFRAVDARNGGNMAGPISAFVPEDAAAFKALIEDRIADDNFDCFDFDTLDRHACLIFQSALGIERDTESPRFMTFLAIETMNVVSVLVSSARYSLMKRRQGESFQRPGTDAELCLDVGYGLCGDHTRTAIALLERLDVRARAVQFFYSRAGKRSSHVAIEADIDGWRYFDTTWGAFWYADEEDLIGSIMSADMIMKSKPALLKSNQVQSWSLRANDLRDPFDYLKLSPSVVYGYDNGTVSIDDPPPKVGANVVFDDIPRSVGDHRDDGLYEGLDYVFPPVQGVSMFNIDANHIGGCESSDNFICVNTNCEKIDPERKTYDIEVRDASQIYVKAPRDSLCYLNFERISIE